jgi:hypothetical protein
MNDILLKSKTKELIKAIDRNTFKVLLFESIGSKEYDNLDNDRNKHQHTDVMNLELYIKDFFRNDVLAEDQKQLLYKSLNEYFNECKVKIKPNKNTYTWDLLNDLIEFTNIELKNKPLAKSNAKAIEIEPIRMELNQTQIVYLFQELINQKLINESINPKLWSLISKYFCDSSGKPIGNVHQTKDKLKNSKTGKPKSLSNEIEKVIADTKNHKKGLH